MNRTLAVFGCTTRDAEACGKERAAAVTAAIAEAFENGSRVAIINYGWDDAGMHTTPEIFDLLEGRLNQLIAEHSSIEEAVEALDTIGGIKYTTNNGELQLSKDTSLVKIASLAIELDLKEFLDADVLDMRGNWRQAPETMVDCLTTILDAEFNADGSESRCYGVTGMLDGVLNLVGALRMISSNVTLHKSREDAANSWQA